MNLKSLTQPELADILKQLGQPAFRAGQVFTWLHKGVRSYDVQTRRDYKCIIGTYTFSWSCCKISQKELV